MRKNLVILSILLLVIGAGAWLSWRINSYDPEKDDQYGKALDSMLKGSQADATAAQGKPLIESQKIYRSVDDRETVTLISRNEVEVSDRGITVLGKYSRAGNSLRLVVPVMGTEQVVYYEILPSGLKGRDGVMLFEPGEYARQKEALAKKIAVEAQLTSFIRAIDWGKADEALSVLKQHPEIAKRQRIRIDASETLLTTTIKRMWDGEKKRNGFEPLVEELCRLGADLNSGDFKNRTPLILACEFGDNAVVEILLKHSADISMRNEEGHDALSYAKQNHIRADLRERLGEKQDPVKKAARSTAPVGVWLGTYSCNQGETSLRLAISDEGNGSLSAEFAFGPSASNPQVPKGTYKMTGTWNSEGRLTLKGREWIDQPTGYFMVSIDAEFDNTSGVITGVIPECNGRVALSRQTQVATATSVIQTTNHNARDTCIVNLRQIADAKELWAIENNKTVGVPSVDAEVATYLKTGQVPKCPAGGTYRFNAVGTSPSCSTAGHTY